MVPSDAGAISERQKSVRELSLDIDIQVDLAAAPLERTKFLPQAVMGWSEAPVLFADLFARFAGLLIAYETCRQSRRGFSWA